MKKIGIIGMGHAFINQYKALKMHEYEVVLCDIEESKFEGYEEDTFTDYHDLVGNVDAVIVSTPPENHFEIIKYFLENDIFVLSEKPLVCNMEELNELDKLTNNNNFYNLFHFSFGEEIEYFLRSEFIKLKPTKIEVFINDPYIENNHIKEENISLHGAYLDEVINPLSALARMYGYNIKYINSALKTYEGDLYDYYANAKFKIDDIDINITSSWNDDGNKEKYIDLYFDSVIIRLDSFNVKVINLTTNEILFSSDKERMLMHYLNALTDFKYAGGNKNLSFIINKEILKYNTNKIIFIGGIPGSGKTTLSYQLASIYKIDKVINLDVLKSILKMLDKDNPYVNTTTHEAYKIDNLSYIDGFLKHANTVNEFYKKVIDNISGDNIIIVEGATITKDFVNKFQNTNNLFINLTINNDKVLINRYKEKLKLRSGSWLDNIEVIRKIDEYLISDADISIDSSEDVINKVREVLDESLFLQ